MTTTDPLDPKEERNEFDERLFEQTRRRAQDAEREAARLKAANEVLTGKLQAISQAGRNLERIVALELEMRERQIPVPQRLATEERRTSRTYALALDSNRLLVELEVHREGFVRSMTLPNPELAAKELEHHESRFISLNDFRARFEEMKRGYEQQLERVNVRLGRAEAEVKDLSICAQNHSDDVQKMRGRWKRAEERTGALLVVLQKLVDDTLGYDSGLAVRVRRRCRRVLEARPVGRFQALKLLRQMRDDRNPGSGGGET
jgi:hypothetical protein